MNDTRLPLGAYVLSGRVPDARAGIAQAQAAEALGLSTLWISEKFGTKDLGALGGALAASTTTPGVAAGVVPFQTRHPLQLASLAATLQSLTAGRFVLGLGRGGSWLSGLGVPPTATARMVVDTVTMLRRLWNGEEVSYRGPAGDFPSLRLRELPATPPPPVVLGGIGEQSLRLAGEHFDGVLLPAFTTPQAIARISDQVRRTARACGRNPDAVRVYATVLTAADPTPEARAVLAGRAATYLQAPVGGERLVRINGWDLEALWRLREHPNISRLGDTYADAVLDPADLAEAAGLIPETWLADSTAIGSPQACAARLRDYLDAGADELVLHGTTPDRLAPVVHAFTALHPRSRPRPAATDTQDRPR
ncbi:TIGR03857 family LLM class F420-dependent oxidoreductase [Lentzea sp. BCCO 10_0061]|uniref:TIGR03857 family LLM class F420-dependent oxidoreductase n=1 Tax=Lentzea sokolovensis TaxID=3095429 RepID=A0ABU4UPF3_9PSEU|nr:TIGR03857 family LLM class F420-dependent oxidoreductase [Lentzea sp. BCCO 10_0061]MDX8141368.1 TIGR03857 family LLM class F420-dependent oxidoreductase [Lentzea sp. BCCO 10_0061]